MNRLISWEELPKWLRDNDFITGSYRPPSNSILTSITSLLGVHNETVNIHTHLWGAVAAIVGSVPICRALSSRHASFTWQDTLAFGTFFLSAVVCLGLSATHHTLSNHSLPVHAWSQKLDHLGIVIMTAGSFLSMIYYGWYCEPQLAYFFSALITTLSVVCATVSLNPKTRKPAWRPYRTAMFAALGLSALIPVSVGLLSHGLEGMNSRIALRPWLGLEFVCYTTGGLIYAARVPERFSPGTFNLCGSSHQIFHVLILCAAAAHLKALLVTFDWNHRSGACADRGLW